MHKTLPTQITAGDILRIEFPLIRGLTITAVECIVARVDDDETETVVRFELAPITRDFARCVFNKRERTWKFFVRQDIGCKERELPVSKVTRVDEPGLEDNLDNGEPPNISI